MSNAVVMNDKVEGEGEGEEEQQKIEVIRQGLSEEREDIQEMASAAQSLCFLRPPSQ